MYENLTFPLNVYALILELNHQPVDYLHFGLFEQEDDEQVYSAQQRSSELILKQIQPQAKDILEIGIGLGTTQQLLKQQGFNPIGLTPDPAQIDIAKKRLASNHPIYCQRFEDFQTEQKYDVVLSQESAQYLDLLELIPKATQLLKANGRLIIIDEIAHHYRKPQFNALHKIDAIEFLAQSCGLKQIYSQALDKAAKYTMRYLLNGLKNHREQILNRITQSESELNTLDLAMQDYLTCYENGDYGYQLLVFEKTDNTENLQIAYLQQQDKNDFQQLFLQTFNNPFSDSLWHWKYKQQQSHSLGFLKANQLVGHYGGFVRKIHYFGKPMQALQIGDTMVARDKRAIFTKNGIFHRLARSFLHRFIGYGCVYPIGFGFPNQRVMKLAQTLGLYQQVGKFTQFNWELSAQKHIPASFIYSIRPLMPEDQPNAELLWQYMSEKTDNFIIGVRDWQRMKYRYFDHPEHPYQLFKLFNRFTQRITAIIVLKIEAQQILLVDIICHPQRIKPLIRATLRIAQQQNIPRVYTLISDNLTNLFAHYNFQQSDPKIAIPHSACTEGAKISEIKDKWWLMAGDSDFL